MHFGKKKEKSALFFKFNGLTCNFQRNRDVHHMDTKLTLCTCHVESALSLWAQVCVEMTETHFFSAIEMTTVGIYVVKDTANSEPSDVGIVIEGVVALRDLENVALASAMLFGLFYPLNMQYPTKLRYTFEVIQKIIMEVDAGELSGKAQSLKTKLHQ
uniref:Uncharacterized protein n=2 Tax=Cyprinus carpio carpio TaxID=630221 RepID=A0A9J8CGL9_CYPCA